MRVYARVLLDKPWRNRSESLNLVRLIPEGDRTHEEFAMKQAPDLDRRRFCGAAAATVRPLAAGCEPTVGSHIVSPRRGYTHHGIYVGRGRVVQYGGLAHGLRRGPVEEIDLIQFSRGRPIWIRIDQRSPLNRDEICRRARSRIGEHRYQLLTNNCEHFCEWCTRGEHCSYQVDELVSQPWRALKRSLDLVTNAMHSHLREAVRASLIFRLHRSRPE